MTNDIVQRLRARVYREVRLPGLAETYPVNPDGAEAADLIVSQAAEIERLKALLEPPRFKCSCVIEMATFRHKGETCPHCGGVIG